MHESLTELLTVDTEGSAGDYNIPSIIFCKEYFVWYPKISFKNDTLKGDFCIVLNDLSARGPMSNVFEERENSAIISPNPG